MEEFLQSIQDLREYLHQIEIIPATPPPQPTPTHKLTRTEQVLAKLRR